MLDSFPGFAKSPESIERALIGACALSADDIIDRGIMRSVTTVAACGLDTRARRTRLLRLRADPCRSSSSHRALKILSPEWRLSKWCMNCATFNLIWGRVCDCCRDCERHEEDCECERCHHCGEKLVDCGCSANSMDDSDFFYDDYDGFF